MRADELSLVQRLQKHDQGARQEFVDDYFPAILRYLQYYVESRLLNDTEVHALATEVLQEALTLLERTSRVSEKNPSLDRLLQLLVIEKVLQKTSAFRRFWEEQLSSDTAIALRDLTLPGGEGYEILRRFKESAELGPRRRQSFRLPRQRLKMYAAEELTPDYLDSQLLPLFKGLAELQRIFDEILGRKYQKVVIRSLKQDSPIGVSFEGAGDAINSLKEDMIPWRKANAKRIADLIAKEAEVEIKRKEAEALYLRAQSAKDRAEAKKNRAEASKINEEVERQRLENEKARFELQSAKLDKALEVVSKIQPNLTLSERMIHALHMVGPIEALTGTSIDLKVLPSTKGGLDDKTSRESDRGATRENVD